MTGLALKKLTKIFALGGERGTEAAAELAVERRKRPKGLALWDQADPRLDVSLFAANVPTFVLNQEQRFLDWNPAFELVFGRCPGVKRGRHVSFWYEALDNFRRVSKRSEKLYGEGILPITDRERVTFLSDEFGRMVFTRILNPVVDRCTGRIIGWIVVLNINSVNKRQPYLESLFDAVANEARRIRYAASYDGLFEGFTAYQHLIDLHAKAMRGGKRVLDLGAGTGLVARTLLQRGHRVTAVEEDVQLARQLRDRAGALTAHLKVVRQKPEALRNLPCERYDGAVLHDLVHKLEDPASVLRQVFESLKPEGVLSISTILPPGNIEARFAALRASLEENDAYDSLKHQFNHVLEYECERALTKPYRYLTREALHKLVLAAGFWIESEAAELVEGHTYLLRARKVGADSDIGL